MDKAAFIVAPRYARRTVVTTRSEEVSFRVPVRVGQLVELEARVVKVGHSSMHVQVEMTAEDLLSGDRRVCTSGYFVMIRWSPTVRRRRFRCCRTPLIDPVSIRTDWRFIISDNSRKLVFSMTAAAAGQSSTVLCGVSRTAAGLLQGAGYGDWLLKVLRSDMDPYTSD